MKVLEKISKKFGFTRTETNVIIFILSACLIGLAVNIFKNIKNDQSYLEFDYKKQDSLFNAVSNEPLNGDSIKNKEEKKIDSHHELLDFTKEKLTNPKAEKSTSSSKIININTATISELSSLPGIGEKTAKGIIEYREKHSRIKNISELLKVKGIGKAKLSKIKDRISIE
ncbi:MAG: helix-hairpin-helix domain-containing protein [Ignavibacteriales bacterium]|nr:MAG: helix-hairpin-helix domain-containing protein [Ignavibacteriales bacterium]